MINFHIFKLKTELYSDSFFKKVLLFELFLYTYLVYNRWQIVDNILKIPKGLRDLISFYETEDGWNFIFLTILIFSIGLTFVKKKAALFLKLTGLLCITTTFIFETSVYSFITIGLLFYYISKGSFHRNQIIPKTRAPFLLWAFISGGCLWLCSAFFPLIKY